MSASLRREGDSSNANKSGQELGGALAVSGHPFQCSIYTRGDGIYKSFYHHINHDISLIMETNIMVYKSLHVLAPQYMCNLFTRASQLTSRCLRNTLTDLRLTKKSSKTGQKCFSFRSVKTWNDVSVEGKLTSCLTTFKKCI